MPSYLRTPSDAVCWNCDRWADETVAVAICTPTGGEAAFRLCDRCYDEVYPSFATTAREAGITVIRAAGQSVPA